MKKTKTITLFLMFFAFISMAQHTDIYEKSLFIDQSDTLRYRIMLPEGFSEDKAYPLILFLHGAGERGNDNEKQLTHGSKLFASEDNRAKFPAIVIFPQCPVNDYWANADVDRSTQPVTLKFPYEKAPTTSMSLVMKMLDKYVSEPFVKKDQVYVMGLSMGGMGTYEILYRKPEVFAAAIPICGGGNPDGVTAYAKKVPVWAFHGAMDNVVDPRLSFQMVSAILDAGGFPRFTVYDAANHNSWDPAFAEPDLLPWLFSHTKTE